MLSTFHQETSGGEKFFLILDRIRQEPARNIDLLELYALCLAMGFEGKYRIQDNGRVRLDALREEVFHAIRGQRGDSGSAEGVVHLAGLRGEFFRGAGSGASCDYAPCRPVSAGGRVADRPDRTAGARGDVFAESVRAD